VNQVPGPVQFGNRLAKDGGITGQSTGSKVVQYFGPRIRPVEREGAAINKLYDQQTKLRKEQNTLRQQNHPGNGEEISADNATPEYTRSLAKSRAIDQKIARLRGEPVTAPSTSTRRVRKRATPKPSGRFTFGDNESSGSSSGSSSGGSSSSGRFTFK
jgi:hypothetical protein